MEAVIGLVVRRACTAASSLASSHVLLCCSLGWSVCCRFALAACADMFGAVFVDLLKTVSSVPPGPRLDRNHQKEGPEHLLYCANKNNQVKFSTK